MKYPISIYFLATFSCLSFMIIIDYFLGSKAEHLNAWVIINQLIGLETGLTDSLAIKKLGLKGAAVLMISINGILGIVLVKIITKTVNFFH